MKPSSRLTEYSKVYCLAGTAIGLALSRHEKGADSSEHDFEVLCPVNTADSFDKPSRIVLEREPRFWKAFLLFPIAFSTLQ